MTHPETGRPPADPSFAASTPAATAEPAAPPAPAGPPTGQRTLPVEFTGSGSEYFRIWIVNLLLTLVTLTLYAPFAKARRLRWLHANTRVDGQALGFHGNPWKMLRGYLLVLAFAVCYGLAGRFAPTAGLAAAALFALLWPALWQASLRFRLANTSWRGLRMRFGGDLPGAYRALAPALLPLGLFLLGGLLVPEVPSDASGAARPPMPAAAGGPGGWMAAVLAGLSPLLGMALVPWISARSKRYQHGHYQFAGLSTTLTATTRAFYGVWLRFGLVTLLPLLVLGAMTALALPAMHGVRGLRPAALVTLAVVGLVVYLAVTVAGRAYLVARLQDLVWNGTRAPQLQFLSDLHATDLAWRLLKNLLLTALTLGLYWPFAVVHTTRLRLQAVRLVVSGDIEAWVGAASADRADAAGDAAGDLLDIDIGL